MRGADIRNPYLCLSRRAEAVNGPFSRHERGRSLREGYGWLRWAWFGKVACMPQPAGPQDAEAFVGRSRELTVLSAATHLDRSVRTGTRCSYSPPDHPS
jgi:hypothetical protein